MQWEHGREEEKQQPSHSGTESETRLRTCVAANRLLSTLLEVEAFDGHWLAIVPSSIDDRPTASLAKDVVLVLWVGQQGPVQK